MPRVANPAWVTLPVTAGVARRAARVTPATCRAANAVRAARMRAMRLMPCTLRMLRQWLMRLMPRGPIPRPAIDRLLRNVMCEYERGTPARKLGPENERMAPALNDGRANEGAARE